MLNAFTPASAPVDVDRGSTPIMTDLARGRSFRVASASSPAAEPDNGLRLFQHDMVGLSPINPGLNTSVAISGGDGNGFWDVRLEEYSVIAPQNYEEIPFPSLGDNVTTLIVPDTETNTAKGILEAIGRLYEPAGELAERARCAAGRLDIPLDRLLTAVRMIFDKAAIQLRPSICRPLSSF